MQRCIGFAALNRVGRLVISRLEGNALGGYPGGAGMSIAYAQLYWGIIETIGNLYADACCAALIQSKNPPKSVIGRVDRIEPIGNSTDSETCRAIIEQYVETLFTNGAAYTIKFTAELVTKIHVDRRCFRN